VTGGHYLEAIEMQEGIAEITRQRISEALFLVGFGVIWASDWLWPGIVVAFGVSWGTSLAIRRKYWAATVVVSLLCLVPTMYFFGQAWSVVLPYLIIGVGATGLARAFYLRR